MQVLEFLATSELHWTTFFNILERLDRMADIALLAVTCKKLHHALSPFLLNHLSLPCDPADQQKEVFSLLVAGILYQSLDNAPFFEHIVTLRFASFYGETPLQHLIRNYLVFIPPSIGLHKQSLLARLHREDRHLLNTFLLLREHEIQPLLGENCPSGLELVSMRGELCKNLQILKQLLKSSNRLSILNHQRFERDRLEVEALDNLSMKLTHFQLSAPKEHHVQVTHFPDNEPYICMVTPCNEQRNLFSIPFSATRHGWRLKAAPRYGLQELKGRLFDTAYVK